MAECECLPRCPFFNDKMLEILPAMVEIYKQKYCHEDNALCARFMVFKVLGRERVPVDLYPNQVERAKQILKT